MNYRSKFVLLILSTLVFSSCKTQEAISTETIKIKPYLLPTSGGFALGIGTCMPAEDGSCYSYISDFEFKWGFNQTIKVEKVIIDSPPEDGSSAEYRLVEVLETSEDEVGAVYTLENLNILSRHDMSVFSQNAEGDYLYISKIFECAVEADCVALLTENESRDSINVNFEYLGNSNIRLNSWY